MKNVFIAGNWKSNKTMDEAKAWAQDVSTQLTGVDVSHLTIVACVPFTLLNVMQWMVSQSHAPIILGAQDVSPYDAGAYTGEICAKQVAEFAEWVIIGHSERRKYFAETDEILKEKVARALGAGLKIIYCVPDDTTPVPAGVSVVAYEPVWAIGTGKSDTPENANGVITTIKQKTGAATVIYGGSVTAENVGSFVATPSIDGVLPGGASLDATKFVSLIKNAISK